VFTGAGIATWLAPGSDFTSEAVDGVNTEILQRYPILLDALRKLAIAALYMGPISAQEVCSLFDLGSVLATAKEQTKGASVDERSAKAGEKPEQVWGCNSN
jgi:hypothetical protein